MESPAERFCCHGCETAYAIIHGAGLEKYYAERELPAPRPGAPVVGWSAIPTTKCPDGAEEVRLQVDGLRCASCVWVLEHVLERTPGVEHAMVSYATGRATIRWNPRRIDLSALATRIAALGYRPRALGVETAPDRALLYRIGVTAFAAFWLMATYEAQYAELFFTVDEKWATLFRWLSLALATPVALWSAEPFYRGAIAGLKRKVLHMDLPISLGIIITYVHGVVATLRGTEGYLDSLGMLVVLLLGGRMLEGRGRRRAVDAAMSLAATAPRTARRATGDLLETVPAESLGVGDLIDVGSGEELAADGVVTEGAGQVRMALLTGEAEPVAVATGDRVVAGTVLVDGALTVQVEAVGRESVIGRMAAELEKAADRGMRESVSDRVAPWFTLGTLVVAVLTLAGWWWAKGVETAVAHTVAVLVVACPCALALSQPLAAAAGLGAAARRGLLFRNADALLQVADVDVIALDKTGTVTAGQLTVVDADDATLRIAAGLERYSAHPIARAILDEASARSIPLPRGEEVHEEAGVGIEGRVDGRRWTLRAGGPTEVLLDGEYGERHVLRLGDVVRGDAATTVAALRRDGVELALLSGDHADVAQRIAGLTGLDIVVSRIDPQGKAAWVQRMQDSGKRVLFAGDGLNDGPALASADVGIAMGTGAASSVLVADGVIAEPALKPLLGARRAARACHKAIRFNHAWSIGYNVLAISAAALGFVNPLVCAVLMPVSSG
ncbi:MAG: heavy metal translocating P-type ATPase, partial [Gemmatimonadales bacterium]